MMSPDSIEGEETIKEIQSNNKCRVPRANMRTDARGWFSKLIQTSGEKAEARRVLIGPCRY